MKGVYCIVTSLSESKKIDFGKNKKGSFPKGFYCYVGSGMKNMEARILRHMSKDKTKFWHIDHFLDNVEIMAVKTTDTTEKMRIPLDDSGCL